MLITCLLDVIGSHVDSENILASKQEDRFHCRPYMVGLAKTCPKISTFRVLKMHGYLLIIESSNIIYRIIN